MQPDPNPIREPLNTAIMLLQAADVTHAEIAALESIIAARGSTVPPEFFLCRRGPKNLAIYAQVEIGNDGQVYVTGYRLEGSLRIFGYFTDAEAEAENVGIPAEIVTPGGRRSIEIGSPQRQAMGILRP